MSVNPLSIVRVLFVNIVEGDRKKFKATSNIADTGGGARDLRFNPKSVFWPFFEDIFKKQNSDKKISKNEVIKITVYWHENEEEKSRIMEIWSPTKARPNEVRIAKISSFDLYDLISDDPNGGLSIFMLFQQENGIVRLHFTTETSLRKGNWHSDIKEFATHWLKSRVKSAFIDLEKNTSYPNVRRD